MVRWMIVFPSFLSLESNLMGSSVASTEKLPPNSWLILLTVVDISPACCVSRYIFSPPNARATRQQWVVMRKSLYPRALRRMTVMCCSIVSLLLV